MTGRINFVGGVQGLMALEEPRTLGEFYSLDER